MIYSIKPLLKQLSLAAALVLTLSLITPTGTVSALSGSNWRAGQIIDDGIFYNSNDMTVAQVQAFLNSKVPTCDTWGTQTSEYGGGTRAQYGTAHGHAPPYICLKDYYENPSSHANNLNGSIPNGSISAAQIIVNAAQAYNISVRALLVTLQKESAGPLITDTWPFPTQYTNAMGYGCPDTAACDPQYAGFYNQVTNAAYQFNRYRTAPANYRYKPQQTNTILYNPNSACGSSSVYLQTTATAGLYNYTPYQPDAAALNNLYGNGDSCSAYGNRNFWRYFNDWFGNTILPVAIKSATSDTVYIQTNGYKFTVPSIALLQDYGISPQSIQTVSQSTLDAIPTPTSDTGLSSGIGYLVKSPSDQDSDGGSVYFISAGRRYLITSMNQFNDFAFGNVSITYLPLAYISALADGGGLSNFIQTPTMNVFQVTGGIKRIIFDGPTYSALNPSGSISFMSSAAAATIPSGAPITNRDIIVGLSSGAIYLLVNNVYYNIPSVDTLDCWGFNYGLNTPLYRLADDNFVGPITSSAPLSCAANINSTSYLLNGPSRVTIPANYGFTAPTLNADLTSLAAKLPVRAAPLGQAIRTNSGVTVWYIEDGTRKPIPSLSDLRLLGQANTIDVIDPGAASVLPASGIKLGIGQVVKTPSSGAVYVVNSASSRLAFSSGDDFVAHGYSWSSIETLPASDLDQLYPILGGSTVNKYLYDQPSATAYLFDTNGCYSLTPSMLTSYGVSTTTLQATQPYTGNIFPSISLTNCRAISSYAKSTSQGTVYWIDSEKKYPISSWSKLITMSQQSNPAITVVNDSVLAPLPVGPTQ